MPVQFQDLIVLRTTSKTAPRARFGCKSAARQRGAATVLMALLVGLAVMASTYAVVQYVRTSQDQSLTVHAQTQAQMNAWTAAELVRQYLAGLSTADQSSLLAAVQASADGTSLNFPSGFETTMAAKLMKTSTSANVVVHVTGITQAGIARAKSTATLELQYKIVNATTGPPGNLFTNTKLGGNITLIAAAGTSSVLNISGDLSSGNYSITGADTINATGTVNIESGSSFNIINSNCDVVLRNGANAQTVNARRHICGSANGKVTGVATANGSILMATEPNGTLSAIGDTTFADACSSTAFAGSTTLAATCDAPTYTGVDMYGGGNKNGKATAVNTKKDVYIGSGSIGTLKAGGDLNVMGSNPTVNGTVGGRIVGSYTGTVTTGGASPTITPVAAVSLTTGTFDANAYRSTANYAFYMAGGKLLVDVKNVANWSDGTYQLSQNANVGGSYDYICPTSTNGDCNSSRVKLNLCSPGTSRCIQYSAGQWQLGNNSNDSSGLRSGVLWFSGDLNVHNGTYYNTFIATGNLSTSGNHTTYAPNYAGYSGAASGTTYAPSGICTNSGGTAIENYPSNFCVNGAFVSSAASGLGSYAYMAGSFSGSSYDASSYVGGNISLGSSTKANGYVLAGNAFTSNSGNVYIKGYVSALGLGVANTSQSTKVSSLGSSTTIDASNLPSTMDSPPKPGGGGGTTVTILYSRYL